MSSNQQLVQIHMNVLVVLQYVRFDIGIKIHTKNDEKRAMNSIGRGYHQDVYINKPLSYEVYEWPVSSVSVVRRDQIQILNLKIIEKFSFI